MQCQDRFAVLWISLTYYIKCEILPECGFTAFWTLSISWSGQYSCANSEYLYSDILLERMSKGSQDKDILCFWQLNR